MTRYHANEKVKGGVYWNPARWQVVTVADEGGELPGEAEAKYVRIPLVMMLLLGPLMGGLYVMFLPFIGFAMVIGYGGRKLLAMARTAVRPVARQEATKH